MKVKPPLWWRLSAILTGMVLLFWLSVEDRSPVSALVMSGLASILGALRYLTLKERFKSLPLRNYLLVGSLTGLCVPVFAAALMTLKTGLHGHGVPDFTPQQYLSVLYSTPAWMIGGILIAAGVALYVKS